MIFAYAALYFCAVLISLVVAMLAWQRQATPGGRALAGLMLALAVWSLAEAGELLATGVSSKIVWSKFSYLGAATCPTLLLAFALEYTRQIKYLTPRVILLRWIPPVITLLLVFTNDWHGLVWNRIEPIPSDLDILGYGHGVWFWINAAYSYAIILAAIFVFASISLRAPRAYRQQAFALLASIIIPLVFNIVFIFGASPIPGLDLSPLAFIVCGLLLAFGIFRLRLLDLVPVARDALIEELSDGVIVLDVSDRIVDINPAAQLLLAVNAQAIGKKIKLISDFLRVPPRSSASNSELEIGARWLDVRVSPLHDPQHTVTGHLIVLRDITETKNLQATLREMSATMAVVEERRRLARDLHDSVAQSLHSLVLVGHTATSRLNQGKFDRLETPITQMVEGAQQALKEMRLLLYNLRPASLEQANLVEAIRLRLYAVEARAGIDAQFTAENVPALSKPVESELYAIAMEALNNSLKHANATQVIFSLRGGTGGVEMEIADNGKGIDAQVSRLGGMGLNNMKERAEKIGGEFSITCAPGQGTRIHLRIEEIQ